MLISDIYPSLYLTGSDLDGPTQTRIVGCEIKEIGREKTRKLVIELTNLKTLVCNKTNFNAIAKLHGGDTDGWHGKPITVFPTPIEYNGNVSIAVRVMQSGNTPIRKPAPPPIEVDLNDEIPTFDGPSEPPPADEDGNPL